MAGGDFRADPRLPAVILDHREPGTALAAFRVAVGVGVLCALVPTATTGVFDVVWTDAGYRNVSEAHWVFRIADAWTLTLCGIVTGAMLVVGLGGRLTALVCLQVLIGLFSINPESGGGHDRLLTNALWLVVLGATTRTLSIDCRLRTGAWTSADPVAAWPRWLAVYQLVLVYFTTGLQKIGADWWPWGDWSALWYALQIPHWARGDFRWLAHVYPLTQLATATTMVFELGSPLLILAFWYRDTRERPGRLRALCNRIDARQVFAGVGLGLHLGIVLTMELGPFSVVSAAFYLCLWSPDEYQRLIDTLAARLGSGSA